MGTLEVYDPSSNSWTTKASMHTPRSQLAVGVIDGKLFAVGGTDGHLNGLRTVEVYDPAADEWRSLAPIPQPYGRYAHAVGVLNGRLYAVGGIATYAGTDLVDAYDPATDTWRSVHPTLIESQGMGAGVIGGVLYIVGGSCYDVLYATVSAYIPP
jgi:N-acetylneuraminic acid mutarotase